MENHSPTYCIEKPEGILIHVFVQPRSAKNDIVGPYQKELKIKITAPPVGGKANKMCIQFFSKCLKVPKSCIAVTSGHTSRSKTLLVQLPDSQSNHEKRQAILEFLSSFTKQNS